MMGEAAQRGRLWNGLAIDIAIDGAVGFAMERAME